MAQFGLCACGLSSAGAASLSRATSFISKGPTNLNLRSPEIAFRAACFVAEYVIFR